MSKTHIAVRPLAQTTVEYRVSGALDGTTGAPDASTQTDEENVFVTEVPGDLGLVSPDLLAVQDLPVVGQADIALHRGTIADRYIQWIFLRPQGVPAADARIAVVDASGVVAGIVEIDRYATLVAGVFYSSECLFVPQGFAIQFFGFAASPFGFEHVIKMGIRAATQPFDEATISNACCCLQPVEAP